MDNETLKLSIQGLLDKGLIVCTLELREGELVEVYKLSRWCEKYYDNRKAMRDLLKRYVEETG